MIKNRAPLGALNPKRSRITSVLLVVLLFNTVSLITINHRKIIGSSNLSQLLATFTTATGEQRVIDESNDLASAEFIRSNYLNSLMIFDFEIPETLINKKPITYDFDPRLTAGVYLNHLTRHLKQGSVPDIPFSWYDWLDIGSVLNQFINLPEESKFSCSFVCTSKFDGLDEQEMIDRFSTIDDRSSTILTQRTLEKRIRNLARIEQMAVCDEYCKGDTSASQPGFRVFQDWSPGTPIVKHIHAKSYLYSEAPVPQSLVMITEKGNLQVGIKPVGDDKTVGNIVKSGLIDEYVGAQGTHINVLEGYKELVSMLGDTPKDTDFKIVLDHHRFVFNGPEYLSTFKTNNTHDESFKKSLEYSLNTHEDDLVKHLKEPKLKDEGDIRGYHYDWRFFNGVKSNEEQRHQILSRLLKSWFEFVQNANLVSWVAHGGLLSHSFNGMLFPWDDDLDVQMPMKDLVELARRFNDSVIIENLSTGYGAYYLDVSDSITHRTKGNNKNHIDARFIDIRTGFFIDITGLAVSSINLATRFAEEYDTVKDTPVEHIDPNRLPDDDIEAKRLAGFDPQIRKELNELKAYSEDLGLMWNLTADEMYDKTYKLELYNCRNGHTYNLYDLSPLRLSILENVPVYVPFNTTKVLTQEYGSQTDLSTDYGDYTYLPQLRIWILSQKLIRLLPYNRFYDKNLYTKEDLMKLLDDRDIMEAYKVSREGSLLNEKERMIMTSELSDTDKEDLLEKLILRSNLKPITKDPFISFMELKMEEVNKEELIKRYTKEMKEALEREYSGESYEEELRGATSMKEKLKAYIVDKTHNLA